MNSIDRVLIAHELGHLAHMLLSKPFGCGRVAATILDLGEHGMAVAGIKLDGSPDVVDAGTADCARNALVGAVTGWAYDMLGQGHAAYSLLDVPAAVALDHRCASDDDRRETSNCTAIDKRGLIEFGIGVALQLHARPHVLDTLGRTLATAGFTRVGRAQLAGWLGGTVK